VQRQGREGAAGLGCNRAEERSVAAASFASRSL
jgi:hypothetical protein